MRFAKGHGTENDFVILPDPAGELDLTAGLVARLCDRRAGLGADGVLRAVLAAAFTDAGSGPVTGLSGPGPDAAPQTGAEWFMDYRNADGSPAEMCGNGIRVFGRYLLNHGLVAGPEFAVATRGGTRLVRVERDGEITVDMGSPLLIGAGHATLAGQRLDGLRVSVGNPHLACLVDTPLAGFDLSQPPVLDAEEFPDGANLELVRFAGGAHILVRVYERGSGVTRSCGTGAVAAAAAAAVATAGLPDGAGLSDGAGLPDDAGLPDAGGRADVAGPPADAGGSPADAGASPADAAGSPADAGGSLADAGGSPADAGASPADAAGSPADAAPAPWVGAAAVLPPAGIWVVDLPGGRLRVTLDGRTSFLTGPAVIVAEGELDESWLSGRPAIPAQSSPAR